MGDALIATPVARIVEWATAEGLHVETGPAAGWPLPSGDAHVVALVEDPKGRLYRAAADGLWAGAFGWMYSVHNDRDGMCGIQVRTDWLQMDPGPFAPYEEGDAVPGADEISKSTWTAEGVIPSGDERPLTPGQALGAAAHDARKAVKAADAAKESAESAAGEAKEGRLAIVDLIDHVSALSRALGVFQDKMIKRLDQSERTVQDLHQRINELDLKQEPDAPADEQEPEKTPETPAKVTPRKVTSK